MVTQTIAFEGDGVWREYAGGYRDWADYQAKRRAEESAQSAAKSVASAVMASAQKPMVNVDSSRKLSYKDSRELAELPERIATLEQEQKAISQRLEDPAFYQADPQEARRISLRLTKIDEELLLLLERWEALEG